MENTQCGYNNLLDLVPKKLTKFTVRYTQNKFSPIRLKIFNLIMYSFVLVILYFFLLKIPFVPSDFKAILLGHPVILFTVLAIPILNYFVIQIIFWLSNKTVKASLTIDYNGLKFETKNEIYELQWFKLMEIHLNEECTLNTIDGNKWIKFKYPIERSQAYKLIEQELKCLELEHLIK